MFLGTDDGLYISLNAGKKWQKWTKGFPTVSTKDLVIHPREHDLVIGTFGRAAWVLDDIGPLRALAQNNTLLNKDIALFTPPNAYQAAYQQPTGSRFGGDALYQGENKNPGAMITYYLKEGKKKSMVKNESENKEDQKEEATTEENKELTGVQKKDSIQFDFYDGKRLMRTLKYKTPEKSGFHRIYWRMDEKGPDRPSRTIRKRKTESGGVDVKPGTYTIKMYYGNTMEETQITVKTDPRLKISSENINEVYTNSKILEGYTQTAADAVKQLVESKSVAETYQKDLKKLDDKKYKDQIDASKAIVKEIDSVIALYIGKVDKRQGITRNPEITVMNRIQNARRYVSSRQTGVTATENQLMKFAKEELNSTLEKTNMFFTKKWSPYQAKMESLNLSPFKKVDTFQIK